MEELSWDLSHQACYYDAAAFVLPHLAVLCARLSPEDKAFLIKEIGLAIGYGTLTKTACSGVELLSNKESFSMNENGNEALAQAQEMLAESGRLDITARRKLWQAMGALEVREQDSSILRTLTGPLKKRARLALVCAKKVMPIWCKCDSEDKRPQGFIKKSFAYLDGEIAAEAAAAAWKAAIVALEDESNLEPWCQVTEEEMDSYDWDAAKNACVAWSDAYADGDNGKCAVREMKFWAWYLEEAAGLLGVEDYRFPQKYIKAFQEKQNPPKPIPGEITLESFAKFLDLGEYVYHYKVEKKDNEDYGYYSMYVRRKEDFGICPICGKKVYKVRQDGMNRRLDWYDNAFPTKEPQLSIIQFDLVFYCPGHPKEIIYSPSSGYKNVKAAVKRYIKGEGRLSKLLNELKHRKTTKYLNICGNFIVINGEKFQALAAIAENKTKLGLADTGWVDVENKILGLELKKFLPNIFIYDRPYDDFIRYWPEKVYKNGNGTVDLLTDEFQLRCTFENEQLVYAEITSLFRIWIKEKDSPALTKVLTEVFELSAKTAELAVRNAENYSGEWEIKPFTALTKEEAGRVFHMLKKVRVQCRILPERFSF